MSGHSHFKTIAATKNANDAKKGKIFSKWAKIIAIAAKDGGDPTKNSKLKTVIDQAKQFNMPKENIERAIKKGSGQEAGEKLEEVSYEAFGPGGVALIIEGITDNSNRTLGEIKTILNQKGGKMAGEGSVKWMFERKGVIILVIQLPMGTITTKEELELAAIEAGADDVIWFGETLEIYTKPEDLENVKKLLEEKGIKLESAKLEYVSKDEIAVSEKEKEQLAHLYEALDENDSINDVFSNLKE